jgi:hypothetical protein
LTTSKIEAGDTVHVRGVVKGVRNFTLAREPYQLAGQKVDVIDVLVDGEPIAVNRSDVVHVEPRPIGKGDRVTWGARELIAEVIAVDDGQAWVKYVDSGGTIGARASVPVAQLVRV